MASLVARIRANLTAKIVLLVCASEVLLLAVLGVFWLRDSERDMRDRLAAKMAVPAALMSQMALGFDTVADLGSLEEIVQEKVVDAFVARRTGDVFFASDPAKLGRPYTDFLDGAATHNVPGGGKLWHSRSGRVNHLALLAPLHSGGDVIGHLFLKIDAAGVVARKRTALLYLLAGSVLAVLLTMAITGFWVNRLFVPRIDRTVAVLEEVRSGRYSARIDEPGDPDQIGHLMRSVDAMIARIDAHTADLQALAKAGKAFAAAESRSDIQRALLAAVGGWLRAEPVGTFDLRQGEDARLSAYQRDMIAAGEVLLVGDPADVPAPAAARSTSRSSTRRRPAPRPGSRSPPPPRGSGAAPNSSCGPSAAC